MTTAHHEHTMGAEPPADTPDYLRPYTERLAETGPTFEALLWQSERTQTARFGAIASMVDLDGRTVLDAGCGRGDLAIWLAGNSPAKPARYIGVDALDDLLDVGRRAAEGGKLATDAEHTRFVHADFASAESPDFYTTAAGVPEGERPDVIVFSGSLNTFEEKHARNVLRWAWKATGQTLIFNFLSDRPGKHFRRRCTGPAKRFNTMRMLRWALTKTPIVAMRHDYLAGNDCTIAMHRPRPADAAPASDEPDQNL